MLLPKQDNSAQFERIDLLNQVLETVGFESIKHVIGHREFIGGHWLKLLIDYNLGFILWVKEGMIDQQNGKKSKLGFLCKKNK